MTQEEKAKAYDEALERARKQRDEYQKEFDKTDKDSKLASILRAAISAVEMAFPELVESEDERMLREIKRYIKEQGDKPTGLPNGTVAVSDMISWLEKQKEKGRRITANLLEDGITGVQRELIEFLANNIDASWVDVIKSADAYAQRIRSMVEKQKEHIEEPKIAFGDWGDKEKKEAIITCLKYMRFIKKITNQEYDDLIKWLDNNTVSNVSEKEECLREVEQKEQKPAKKHNLATQLKEHFANTPKEQLEAEWKELEHWNNIGPTVEEYFNRIMPAEWSEEDEKTIDDAYCWLCEYAGSLIQKNYGKSSMLYGIANKLKSLHSCPKSSDNWKPSEQEKGALRTAISILTEERNFPKAAEHLQAILDAFEGKESRKDWKPSEEQMKALKLLVEYVAPSEKYIVIIKNLYDDLRKLM